MTSIFVVLTSILSRCDAEFLRSEVRKVKFSRRNGSAKGPRLSASSGMEGIPFSSKTRKPRGQRGLSAEHHRGGNHQVYNSFKFK